MAVKFDVEHTRSSEYRMFPEGLVIKPELNGRHDLPDIRDLITDILAQGQLIPVVIRNDGGKPVLVAGFSRWRAISEINEKHLAPVKMQIRCCYTQCSEAEAFLANISENRFRSDVTAIDDARNLHLLMKKYAMTEDQVVKVYFPNANAPEDAKRAYQWVKGRVALIDLSPEAADAFLHGRMKESAARAIAKLSQAQQKLIVEGKGEGEKITSGDVKDSPGVKRASMRPQTGKVKVSKLRGLADAVMMHLDDEDLAGDGEYITAERASLKKLLEAIV